VSDRDGPKTPKASGSYEIAGARVVWCREIALAAERLPGAAAASVAVEATVLSRRFESWLGPRRKDGKIVPATTRIEERAADMAAWTRLLADAARLGVSPF
jgi:hypothetical protein